MPEVHSMHFPSNQFDENSDNTLGIILKPKPFDHLRETLSIAFAKLLYDRATLPLVWLNTAPYDPDLPIRGRYANLQLIVDPRGVKETKPGSERQLPPSVSLSVENGRLLAVANQGNAPYNPSDLHVRFIKNGDQMVAVLDKPVAFFIPENIPDSIPPCTRGATVGRSFNSQERHSPVSQTRCEKERRLNCATGYQVEFVAGCGPV